MSSIPSARYDSGDLLVTDTCREGEPVTVGAKSWFRHAIELLSFDTIYYDLPLGSSSYRNVRASVGTRNVCHLFSVRAKERIEYVAVPRIFMFKGRFAACGRYNRPPVRIEV